MMLAEKSEIQSTNESKSRIFIKVRLHVMRILYTPIGAVMVVIVWQDLQLPMQSVPHTTKVVSANPAQARCTIQHVIKFVSDFRRVGGFLRVLRFLPLIKLTTGILLKVALKHHITLTLYTRYWKCFQLQMNVRFEFFQVYDLFSSYSMETELYMNTMTYLKLKCTRCIILVCLCFTNVTKVIISIQYY